MTTQTTPQKSSIKQQLRTDLGRSVGVTTATQLVWLTDLRAHLPTPRKFRKMFDKNAPKNSKFKIFGKLPSNSDPRPFRLLVRTPSILGSEFASRRAEHCLLRWISLYMFNILFRYLCTDFKGLSALIGYWSSVFKRIIIYIFYVCPFYYTCFMISGKVGISLTGLTTPVG